MPHQVPLRTGDPRRVGRYVLAGRLEGIPSDEPIFVGTAPDGSEVSLSMLGGSWANDGAARDRFTAEAAVAKRVPPFCAARVLDAGLDGGAAYLVSEYIPGESLLELVASDGVRRGHELEALAIGMATGLASVHQAGLVHGNFGPEYVIMVPDAPLRVVEFGITPPYGTATPSADMLAWAHTVVFAASGRPPASTADLDVLPEHLRDPVEQCLNLDPAERPPARSVVQFLLGDAAAPAGLLAEGSRRSARATRSGYDLQLAGVRPGPPGTSSGAGGGRPGSGRLQPGPAERGSHPSWPPTAVPRTRQGRPPARRRTGWLVGSAVVVVIIAVGAFALHLFSGSSGQQPGVAATEATQSPSVSPTAASPPPGLAASSFFVGSWSGHAQQPPTNLPLSVQVTFYATPGKPGTISYSGTGVSCSGELAPTQVSSTKMTMQESTKKVGCASGQVTVTKTGLNSISFSFANSGGTATGTLSRS